MRWPKFCFRYNYSALQKREKEADINCLTSSGLPAPLGTINRKPKQETAHLIPDDGFVSASTLLNRR